MIFHFTILLWTIIFSIGLEFVALNPFFPTWNWYIFSILPLIIISFLACQKITKRSTDTFLPGLLSFAVPTLLSLIDSPIQRQIFVGLSALMYYFALLGLYRLHHSPNDKTARAFLNSAAVAGLFFYYTGIYGFYLNFSFPLWGLMLLYFLGTALTSYKTLTGVGHIGVQGRRRKLYSMLLGLFMGEMAWVISFWPFGYLTTGSLALVFFYLAWDTSFDAFYETLSLKKALLRTLFFVFLIGVVLFSTPWWIVI